MGITDLASRLGLNFEFVGKVALIVFFGSAATLKLGAISSLVVQWSTIDSITRWTYLAAHVCGLTFMILIIATTIIRYRPVRSAEGIEPRVSALAGTFLGVSLGLLPPVEISPAVTLAAVGLAAGGAALSAWVLLWLGRSFSIMAQARKLVTSGPYSIVRHPLYCCEAPIALGVMLLVLSPLAVAIVIVQWCIQLRRMANEEKVLRAEFMAYEEYAARVPKLFPRLFGRP